MGTSTTGVVGDLASGSILSDVGVRGNEALALRTDACEDQSGQSVVDTKRKGRELELTRINTLDMSLSDEEFLELGDIFALIFIFSQGKKKWNVIRRRKKVIDRIFSTT